VNGRIDPAAAVPLVREQLRAVDPEVPMYDVVPFADRVAALVMPQRLGVVLFTLFSALALALALATVGIYGVATYVASLRTREIGIRIALGATTGAVRRMVLVQGVRPIVAGILAGLAMAIYASGLAEAFLLNVSPLDPLTFVTVPLTIAAIALFASYLPARRASRIEPMQALRDD
jgi:putative ABC transport system permease protein